MHTATALQLLLLKDLVIPLIKAYGKLVIFCDGYLLLHSVQLKKSLSLETFLGMTKID